MFSDDTIEVGIILNDDVNIGSYSKDNITVSYLKEDDSVIKTKDKTWARYLNDVYGNKYGNGTKKQEHLQMS